MFTVPYLEKSYGKVFYFTQYDQYDKEIDFKEALNEALINYEIVDIFLLAHSNQYYKWVLECNSEYLHKIRMVYNTGCSNIDQADYWIDIGSASYVSHKGNLSLSPIFYFYFLRRWAHGDSLDNAVKESNHLTEKIIPLLYLFLDIEYDISNYQDDTRAYIFGDETLKIGSNK